LDGTASFKANGLQLSSAAELASYLPVQVINSNTFLLLEGSPQVRRQFMDWLVFHVEPKFYQAWKDCERCLKHRNSLLRRDRIDDFELACMEQFLITFNELLQEFINVDGLSIHYYRGWDKDKSYRELLQASIQRDHQLGYTHSGIHRADLRITLRGQNAAEVLSRGQQKLLVCALKIAQGLVFTRLTGRKTVYLVDDLPAELDEKHRQLLAHWLDIMATQVFITGVEQETLRSTWQQKPDVAIKVFHVEHGEVKVAS
jgi:DNA replication and repair protein RecF